MNPLKKVVKKAGQRLGLTKKKAAVAKMKEDEMDVIWPVGTWQLAMAYKTNFVDLDYTVQAILKDTYIGEEHDKFEKANGHRPGGMGGMDLMGEVPAGWRPSEKYFKEMSEREKRDVKYVHYIVARLKHLGTLRP